MIFSFENGIHLRHQGNVVDKSQFDRDVCVCVVCTADCVHCAMYIVHALSLSCIEFASKYELKLKNMPHLFVQHKSNSFKITVSTTHQQLFQLFVNELVANEDSFFQQWDFKTKVVFKGKNTSIIEFYTTNNNSSFDDIRAVFHVVLSDFMWKEHWKLVHHNTFWNKDYPPDSVTEWTYRLDQIGGHYN